MDGKVEAFVPLNGSVGNSAPVGGRRRGSRKLKLVTKKQARKMLKSMGKRMRGGADEPAAIVEEKTDDSTGGRRRRGTKKTRRGKRRSLFGMRY
jgi:hypothetical protein